MIERGIYNFRFDRKHERLKVASILDKFSYEAFKYECDLFQITPDNWQQEIENFNPDMLFIESAWGGKDDKWGGKLITAYREIGDLARYCAKKAIPIVFWSKEDPFGYNPPILPQIWKRMLNPKVTCIIFI